MNNKVKIKISGKNPSLFIKLYIFNKIKYKNYKVINHNEVSLIINYDDYLKLKEIKNIYDIKVIKYYGLIKYETFFKENKIFTISLLFGVFLVFILSNITFKIDVIHNDKNIRSLVKEELKKEKISEYKISPSYEKRVKVINKIIKNNKNKIEWLEIEKKGSILIIKVAERRLNKKEEDNAPRHIVAKKDGIIKKIEATSGEVLKKKNDYVSKGDIIISGDIIKDDTVKQKVRAKGKVYAEVWYKVNVSYPLNYNEVVYLDDVKTNVVISFMNKDYNLFKNYSKMYLEKKKTFIKSKIFPFSISLEKQRKIKVKKRKYTAKEAKEKAVKKALDKMKKYIRKDNYIISKKTLNFRENNSTIVIDVFFKVYEDITSYKDVDPNLLKIEESNN